MAAPFTLVMVLLCVALARDLRDDPLVRRGQRCTVAIEQAVEFGTKNYGNDFFVPVKPHPARVTTSSSGNGAEPGTTSPQHSSSMTLSPVDRSDKKAT
jgi:hypothetical protein